MKLVQVVFVAMVWLAAGCGDPGDTGEYATFEACWMDHHVTEALSVQKSITICCLDHSIGSSAAGIVCGADAGTCATYVTANLPAADATSDDITAACDDYEFQKSM
jgi:hypothetical protein